MAELPEHHAPMVIVAAIGRETRAIGKNNQILWHVADDLKRFKELTLGHPVIMGRRTFESILALLKKPLSGRTNIVITRDSSYQSPGVLVAHSLPEAIALAQAENPTEIHIGGGGELYRQALPYVSKLYLTLFDDDQPGDAYFPPFAAEFEKVKEYPVQNHNGIAYQWVDYVRKPIL